MSCKTFLRSFAYQYCKHKYIKKNCCASHQTYCLKSGRSRTRRGRTLIFRSTNSNATSTSNSTTHTYADKKSNIRNQSSERLISRNENSKQNNTDADVAFKNSTYTPISRISLSALPSVSQQQQQTRFRTNRFRYYRSTDERR